MAEEEEKKKLCTADHNVSRSALSLDPPILRIAEATGQQIARERPKPPAATASKLNCSILVGPLVQIRMSSLTIACCRERLDPCRFEEQGAMNYRK